MDHGAIGTGPLLELGGSLAAVLAVAAYVHLVWDRRRPAVALDRERALALFGAEHPEVEVDDALVTIDGRAALVRGSASMGLVVMFGARWRTRVLDPRAVAALVPTDDGLIRVATREAAQPAILLRFPDHAARTWLADSVRR